MGYALLRACLDDLEATGQLRAHRRRDRSASGSGRDPAPRLSGRRAGDLLRPRQGLPVSDGQQPVRHAGARALHLSRLAGGRAAAGRAQGRSRRSLARRPLAACRHCCRRCGTCCRSASLRGPVLADETTIDRAAAAQVAGPTTAARSSRCRRSIPKTPTTRAGDARTSACIACSFPAAQYQPNARSACTIRFIAASACIMRPRFAAASRCG